MVCKYSCESSILTNVGVKAIASALVAAADIPLPPRLLHVTALDRLLSDSGGESSEACFSSLVGPSLVFRNECDTFFAQSAGEENLYELCV